MISLKIQRKFVNILLIHIYLFFYRNPNKGVIINRPHGKDVYHGVPKDYTGAVKRIKIINLKYFLLSFDRQ